jgi:hypothetical protein
MHSIWAGATFDSVITATAIRSVDATTFAVQLDLIVTWAPEHRVGVTPAVDVVVPCAPLDSFSAFAAFDAIGAAVATSHIIPG